MDIKFIFDNKMLSKKLRDYFKDNINKDNKDE
jgi:hypothetical protein